MRIESIDDRIEFIKRFMPLLERIHISEVGFLADPEVTELDAHEIRSRWKTFIKSMAAPGGLSHFFNFYLHVPFCPEICTFCVYPARKPRNNREIKSYIRSVKEELEFFSDTFEQTVFQNLYVGGGTPNFLENRNIEEIILSMKNAYRFVPEGMRIIECLPAALTREKIDTMIDLGFNRLSIGVQSLDEDVLKTSKRPFSSLSSTLKVIKYAADRKEISVNVDLMVGLYRDDKRKFIKTLRRIIPLRPDHITIYRFQPPRAYVRKHFRKNYSNYQKHFTEKFSGILETIIREAGKSGYLIDNPDESKQGWQITREGFVPAYDGKRPYEVNALAEISSSCFAVGEFANSHMFGAAAYRHAGRKRNTFDPSRKLFHYRGVSIEHEMLRHIYYYIYKYRTLYPEKFKAKFNVDIEARFGSVIRELTGRGMIKIEKNHMNFTSEDVDDLFVASRLFLDRKTLIESFKNVDRAHLLAESGGRKFIFEVGLVHPQSFHIAEKNGRALFAVDDQGGEINPKDFHPMQQVLGTIIGNILVRIQEDNPALTSAEIVRCICQVARRKVRSTDIFPSSWRVMMRPMTIRKKDFQPYM